MKYSYEEIDGRIVKTRIALSDAILSLIKDSKQTKVLDICQKAKITPMTYYHHFNNRTQLLDFAVKSQLECMLPIPKKLKPISIKHLVFYLINSFSKFIQENKELIISSIKQGKKHGYSGSYIYLFFVNVKYLVKQELKLLCHNNLLDIELWNDFICGSLFNVALHMISSNQYIATSQIWASIKNLAGCFI